MKNFYELHGAKLAIVGIKFFNDMLVIDCVLTVKEIRTNLSFDLPLVGEKTKHIKSYRDLLEKTILEYLSERPQS